MSRGIPRLMPVLAQLQSQMSNKHGVESEERLTCQTDCRALLEGGQGDEIVLAQGGIHHCGGLALIELRMHLAGEIVCETVEGEERWIGNESAETRSTGATDDGCVAFSDSQRGVVNEAEGRCGTLRQRPRTEQHNAGV